MADPVLNGKYIIELDELSSIELDAWLSFQPDEISDQAFRISLTNFISALPIIPAVAGEYDKIADLLAAQAGQTVDVFYSVADPSDDPDYNDLKDSEIKTVYYHLVDAKTASLSDYNSIAVPKLESSKFPKLGNSLQALTFDVKFRTGEWSSNQATLQAISNALKIASPQDLLLDAISLKLNASNNPTDISRVLFGLDGSIIFEPITSAKIQSDSDATDVTLNDSYQLLLTITGDQNITNGIANIGLTAKSFSDASITAFQASGNNRVRATSALHGLIEGDYVEIVNTVNYDGIYEIKAVPNINDFDFTKAFVATETGDWEKSKNREIAVDLRINAISVKEFTRQIEGEGRLNFSEQISLVTLGHDIDIYVKSNTVGEAIEILGTIQSSELKVIRGGNSTLDDVMIQGNITSQNLAFEKASLATIIHLTDDESLIIQTSKAGSPQGRILIDGATDSVKVFGLDNGEIVNFLVAGTVFKGQAAVEGTTITFTATPTFDFENGNVQKMIVTANITSLAISNELDSGNYTIFLTQNGTGGYTIPVPGASFGTITKNSVPNDEFATTANDVNIIQIMVDPDGNKFYSIEVVEI